MNDLISRQKAINTFLESTSDGDRAEWCKWVLEKVPSAQPERKQGRWVNRSLNILYPESIRYICSVCGKYSYSYDFCPNCGADMRGEVKDE